jgi:hypothetical protein
LLSPNSPFSWLQAEIEKVQKRREEKEAEKQRMEEELVRVTVWFVGFRVQGKGVRQGRRPQVCSGWCVAACV